MKSKTNQVLWSSSSRPYRSKPISFARRSTSELTELICRLEVPEAINILSQYYELTAGDIILTGTPENIGLVFKGDVVNVGIEGLGEIEVHVT